MTTIEEALAQAWQLHTQGQVSEAERAYLQVLQAAPHNAEAWCYLGLACYDQDRLVEAEQAYRQALRLRPDFAVAENNLGNALKGQARFDEAAASFERAIGIDPDYANAHYNLGMTLLLSGDQQRGWREFRWREKSATFAHLQREGPRWNGQPLGGKTILLLAEQGLGDTIQFIRYAPLVAACGGRVVVQAQQALLPLLQTCDGIDQLIPPGESPPEYDFYAPLMSLPAILGVNDAGGGSYLRADDELVAKWREQLAGIAGLKIGIAWQGNPQHASDRQRSLPLAELAPLAALDGVTLVSLQKGPGSEQLAALAGSWRVVDLAGRLDNEGGAFRDTAAVMKNLDLVITADTSIAHLAGALKVPVWVALSQVPDWRWGRQEQSTSWYASMRLFRQSRGGEWGDVVQRMASQVAQLGPDVRETKNSYRIRRSGRLASSGFHCLKRARHGYLLYNRHDAYIGRSIELYGEFSESEVAVFRQFLRPGDVVVEAGANIGAHTLPLAQIVGRSGRVWAFEPQRIVFQTLCANIALNSLANVDCRQAAVGAAAGSLVVPPLDYNAPNNFGGLGLGEYTAGEQVGVVTIDSLELDRCSFIKADVEGMEADVLAGARETIEAHKPMLYVENDRREKSPDLIESIAALDYNLYWHLPRMFNRRNFFENEQNVFGELVSVNMLCLHKSLAANIQGLKPVESPQSYWGET